VIDRVAMVALAAGAIAAIVGWGPGIFVVVAALVVLYCRAELDANAATIELARCRRHVTRAAERDRQR
jgi:hypothetical protein